METESTGLPRLGPWKAGVREGGPSCSSSASLPCVLEGRVTVGLSLDASYHLSDTPVPPPSLCGGSGMNCSVKPDPDAPSEAPRNSSAYRTPGCLNSPGCFSRAGTMSENSRKIPGIEGREQGREEGGRGEIMGTELEQIIFQAFIILSK